ncbi:MAG: transcriptional repressor [Solirubrobacterales bacterium]|nr:transcriptional repressor [Solirubrobacterales bacterium]
MPSTSTDDLVALLHSRGQRVTSQRLMILRALRRHVCHLTASQIYNAVREELPGTSAPTIYATLELLVELGLIRRLDVGLGVARYDARTDPHQHMVCRCCGTVEDLEGEVDLSVPVGLARSAGFQPDRAELVLTGLCVRCARPQ